MPEEKRVIRWYGILKPPEEAINSKQATLQFSIIRPHSNLYMSKRSRPNEYFFGYAALLLEEMVVDVVPLRYEKQILFYFFNDNLWLHQNVSCHLEATLTSIVNLGASLGLPPIERVNPIEDWEVPTLPFDEVRVQLEEETAVCELNLVWDEMEECEAGGSPPPRKPPPTRPTPPKVPPNTPDNELPRISPPYEGEDDNGNTYRPEDEDDLPETGECVLYLLVIDYVVELANPPAYTQEYYLWGELTDLFFGLENDNWSLFITCRGQYPAPCSPAPERLLLNTRPGSESIFQYTIVSVTETDPPT